MENIKILSDDVLTKVRRSIKLVSSIEEADKLIKYVNKMIKYLDKIIKNGRKIDSVECVCELEENLTYLHHHKERLIKKNRSIKLKKDIVWIETESSFNKKIRTGLVVNLKYKDPKIFFDNAFKIFFDRVKNDLQHCIFKINATFSTNFILPDTNRIKSKEFSTRAIIIQRGDDIDEWYLENVVDELTNRLTEFDENDSGWTLHEILYLRINLYEYSPISGRAYIELPKEIQNKRAVINIKNYDNYCFLWAVVSALHPAKKRMDRISSYPHFSKVLKYDSINFPMRLQDIPIFESLNNLSINVYGFEDKSNVVPIYLSKYYYEKQISLLLINNDVYNEGDMYAKYSKSPTNYHYAWIKNISRLLSSQLTRSRNRVHICFRCLNHFSTDLVLQKHLKLCDKITKFAFNLPADDEKILKFKNNHKKEKQPFVIYVDFDCIVEKTDDVGKRVPFIIALYFKCAYDDSLSFFRSYRGNDCQDSFVDELKRIINDLQYKFNNIVPMKRLTEEQKISFAIASVCHICDNPFTKDDVKVRDWCHFTGNYRGLAHRACDLNYRTGKVVPVVFRSLSKNNTNFLIKLISSSFKGNEILAPMNETNCISFSKYIDKTGIILRLLDSTNFIYDSVGRVGTDLNDDVKRTTRNCFGDLNKIRLLTEKLLFPHEYVDSYEELDEKYLPSRENFLGATTDRDYGSAVDVWKTFNIKTLGEYSDLYFKANVLLLTDIFESFRENSLTTYKLDPLRYHTVSELAYDAMLRVTRVELELLTDADKVLFIESGIRGGLSQVSCRHAKANNKYMGANHDTNKDDSFLMYFGTNRLNDSVMSKKLPYKDIEWVENYNDIDLDKLTEESDTGYIFQVDLDYPNELHRTHNDLPLCPEKITSENSKFSKLIANLNSKNNYVIHYMNLKQCIDLGMKLTRIHKVLKFKQSHWLKSYVDLNNRSKNGSTDEFSRRFYETMNDVVFDTFVEDFKQYRDRKLVMKWETHFGVKCRISKPNFHSCTIIDDNSVLLELNKTSIKFNKPTYVGFTLRDLIKTHVYDFHYGFIKSDFGLNVKLLYVDKDSLIYNFINVDAYEIISQNLHRFDTSNYPPDNRYKIPSVNRDVAALTRDKLNGRVLYEFIGFRSKMYSLRIEADGMIERCDDTTKTISFDDFMNCLSNNIESFNLDLVRCNNIVVYTTKQKQSLTVDDDKRKIADDNINTFAWGYEQ